MPKKVKIAQTDDLSPGAGKVFEAEGQTIALFNVDGTFYAIDNTCTHKGGPLGEGDLIGDQITGPPARSDVKSFVVTVEGSDVLIELD